MPETAMLHFDLRHVSPEQPLVLRAGKRRYDLTLHTWESLARSRRSNAALDRLPDGRITHYADTVHLPDGAPVLLRVTAPALAPDEPLDRLVLTGIHLPRRYRVEGLQRRRRRGQGRPAPSTGRSGGRGAGDPFPVLPDKVVIDAGDLCTPLDAAHSLVFHHAELLTTQAGWATDIVYVITTAAGINDLADAIARQAKAHEQDPNQPNWVTSRPGTNWRTGQPTSPIYVWSDETLEYLRQPLWDTLQATKDDTQLELQCWTALPGITRVPMSTTPDVRGAQAPAEATYTVKNVTPQSGVENSFAYDQPHAKATISFKNYYLRWL